MTNQAHAIRRQREERRHRNRLRKLRSASLLLVGMLVLTAIGWMVWSRSGAGGVEFQYRPQDIVYDRPALAVHEMSAGPPIPFLPKGGPQPKIVLNEVFLDLGLIGPTEVVTREFVIANQGEAPLTISRAYTTCGCTMAEITSTIIPPGKVALMTVIFDAGFHDVRGQTVRRGVILENNDPSHPEAQVWLQASVLASP